MKFHHRYVCEPNHITITAESIPTGSKGIKIMFYLYNKKALMLVHSLQTYTPTKDDVNDHVARCCNFIKGSTEDYIQDRFDADEIMGILHVHRSLKKVQTLSGKTIWRV